MKHFSMIDIDGNSLAKALKDRGLHASHISVDEGYSVTWISTAIKRGKCSPATVKALERYGISLDEYKVKPDDDAETPSVSDDSSDPVPETICTLTKQELYDVIRAAVTDALKGE